MAKTDKKPHAVRRVAKKSPVALSELARGLGHPLRVEIFRQLRQEGTCLCGDLVDMLPRAQSTVSQHLKILKDSGLIKGEIDGPRVCYCVDEKVLGRLKKLIAGL